jgi:hypothetical protein
MKIQDQVCTLNQSLILKTLGVIQESAFYYHPSFDELLMKGRVVTKHGTMYKKVPVKDDKASSSAFTVSELAAMIGKGTNAASLLYDAVQARMNQSHSFTICYSPQFLANCVIGLLETGRLTPAEVNQRLTQ